MSGPKPSKAGRIASGVEGAAAPSRGHVHLRMPGLFVSIFAMFPPRSFFQHYYECSALVNTQFRLYAADLEIHDFDDCVRCLAGPMVGPERHSPARIPEGGTL